MDPPNVAYTLRALSKYLRPNKRALEPQKKNPYVSPQKYPQIILKYPLAPYKYTTDPRKRGRGVFFRFCLIWRLIVNKTRGLQLLLVSVIGHPGSPRGHPGLPMGHLGVT